MTAQRQERNQWRPGLAFIAFSAGLFWTGVPAPGVFFPVLELLVGLPAPAEAATTERVVVNRYSGLAIDGFDPVAYFTDAHAERGLESFEASEGGAVWRFRNEGNRASFVVHPEIYGPRFGGYDPTDVARGVAFPGNPRLWLIAGQRLYLFGREQSRDAFAADPQRFLRDANQRWPELEQHLAQ